MNLLPILQRFERHISPEPNTGCWLWSGSGCKGGYGQVWDGARRTMRMAHRVTYELAHGPIADGLEIDHLCKVTACVNPDHLEAVTPRVNALRSNNPMAMQARQTHCKYGHPFSGENLLVRPNGTRICRTCNRRTSVEKSRRYYWRHRELIAARWKEKHGKAAA